jgi:hypothetical protein
MNCADIIGYTADADVWCESCAAKAYPGKFSVCGKPGVLTDPGWCPDCGDNGCHVEAFDHEGNEVHPIFGGDEFEQSEYCCGCGACIYEKEDEE